MLTHHQLASVHLHQPRWLSCFQLGVPVKTQAIAICFDGQSIPSLSATLTTHASSLPPLLLIGVHSVAELRSREYLRGNDDAMYKAHELFLLDEVIPWAQKKFDVELDRTRMALVGFSNGATLALSLGLTHADRFGSIIAFSPAGGMRYVTRQEIKAAGNTKFYLAAGQAETPFRRNALAIAHELHRCGHPHQCHIRTGYGHELRLWASELPQALKWMFAVPPD